MRPRWEGGGRGMEGKGGREAATESRAPTALGSGRRARRSGQAGGRGGQTERMRGGRGRQARLGHGSFIRLCRANDQGASLPRQDRWRSRPCHVTGQQPRSSPRHPATAPPCICRAMAIGAAKSVSLKKTVLDLKLVYKKCYK